MPDKKTESKCKCPTHAHCAKCDCAHGSSCECKCGAKCRCGHDSKCSILPLCCFISMLTAVFITLIFSVAFVGMLVLKQNRSEYAGSFLESTTSQTEIDNYGFTKLNSAAVIDMIYLSERSGLVLVTGGDDSVNGTLANLVMNASSDDGGIYHYSVVEKGDKADNFVKKALIDGNSDNAPTLLYVRDGQIYDRIDDIRSESSVATFVARYQ